MRFLCVFVTVLSLCTVGCSRSSSKSQTKFDFKENENRPDVEVAQDPMRKPPAARLPAGKEQAPDKLARKIKYTGEVRVIVEDFDKAEEKFTAAVKDAAGIIAHSEITSSPAQPRRGVYRIRVPVAQFEAFRAAVRKLGEVEHNSSDSEDVTEAYYDLEAHIKNRQVEEDALRKLMDKAGDNLKNILEINEKLNQVRDDINRKTGQLKRLADLTDLTTVNVTLRERQKYDAAKAPVAAEVPTFGMRAGRAFSDSLGGLVEFGQAVLIFVITLAPWLPLLLIGGFVGWRVLRSPTGARAIAKLKPVGDSFSGPEEK